MPIVAALLAFGSGCGEPEPGDPCEPGSAPIRIDNPLDYPAECPGGPYAGASCGLTCFGPPGCGDDVEFHWVVHSETSVNEWCACDGTTDGPAIDIGSLPNERWQWHGSCEEPCERVAYSSSGHWYYEIPLAYSSEAVDPRCTDCSEARELEGRCQNPDGLTLPNVCCDCVIARDGTCQARGGPDLVISPTCCDTL